MNLAAIKCSFAESFAPVRSVDSQIRAFLAGEGEGEELLHSIFTIMCWTSWSPSA